VFIGLKKGIQITPVSKILLERISILISNFEAKLAEIDRGRWGLLKIAIKKTYAVQRKPLILLLERATGIEPATLGLGIRKRQFC